MTRAEVYELLENGPPPGEGFLHRICREKAFRIIGERRRALVEAMYQAGPDHPSRGRAECILVDMDRNLREWMESWQPDGKSN